MSLCDELYQEAHEQLVREQIVYSPDSLDRRFVRLLCERLENLIADFEAHRSLHRAGTL
jgi:hypothetical protein